MAPAQLASPSVISCTAGIDSVVLEDRSREYVAARIRAGVLEQGVVDMLVQAGAGERLLREGLIHHGIEPGFDGERHRIPLSDLAGGRAIVIYGQTELVKDQIQLRLDTGRPLHFGVEDVTVPTWTPTARSSATATTAATTSSSAAWSPAATGSTGSAVRASRRACCPSSRASTRSAGWGFSPRSRPRATSSSYAHHGAIRP